MDIDYHLEEKLKEGQESIDILVPILNDIFEDVQFERFDNGGDIDRNFSVDLQAIYPDRTETWAVKIRDNNLRSFDDITIEILNGDRTKGDFYRFNGNMVSKYIYGWNTPVFCCSDCKERFGNKKLLGINYQVVVEK